MVAIPNIISAFNQRQLGSHNLIRQDEADRMTSVVDALTKLRASTNVQTASVRIPEVFDNEDPTSFLLFDDKEPPSNLREYAALVSQDANEAGAAVSYGVRESGAAEQIGLATVANVDLTPAMVQHAAVANEYQARQDYRKKNNKAQGKLPDLSAVQKYIIDSARQRGIDPEIALRVAKSEGLSPGVWQSNIRKNGNREPSYGPFQLLVGGKGTGFPEGLGNDFLRRTGKSPSDPSTWKEQIDFSLDHASRNGWDAWYGAAKAGVGDFDGIQNRATRSDYPTTYDEPSGGLSSQTSIRNDSAVESERGPLDKFVDRIFNTTGLDEDERRFRRSLMFTRLSRGFKSLTLGGYDKPVDNSDLLAAERDFYENRRSSEGLRNMLSSLGYGDYADLADTNPRIAGSLITTALSNRINNRSYSAQDIEALSKRAIDLGSPDLAELLVTTEDPDLREDIAKSIVDLDLPEVETPLSEAPIVAEAIRTTFPDDGAKLKIAEAIEQTSDPKIFNSLLDASGISQDTLNEARQRRQAALEQTPESQDALRRSSAAESGTYAPTAPSILRSVERQDQESKDFVSGITALNKAETASQEIFDRMANPSIDAGPITGGIGKTISDILSENAVGFGIAKNAFDSIVGIDDQELLAARLTDAQAIGLATKQARALAPVSDTDFLKLLYTVPQGSDRRIYQLAIAQGVDRNAKRQKQIHTFRTNYINEVRDGKRQADDVYYQQEIDKIIENTPLVKTYTKEQAGEAVIALARKYSPDSDLSTPEGRAEAISKIPNREAAEVINITFDDGHQMTVPLIYNRYGF